MHAQLLMQSPQLQNGGAQPGDVVPPAAANPALPPTAAFPPLTGGGGGFPMVPPDPVTGGLPVGGFAPVATGGLETPAPAPLLPFVAPPDPVAGPLSGAYTSRSPVRPPHATARTRGATSNTATRRSNRLFTRVASG
jgi:hypothetical protein